MWVEKAIKNITKYTLNVLKEYNTIEPNDNIQIASIMLSNNRPFFENIYWFVGFVYFVHASP